MIFVVISYELYGTHGKAYLTNDHYFKTIYISDRHVTVCRYVIITSIWPHVAYDTVAASKNTSVSLNSFKYEAAFCGYNLNS